MSIIKINAITVPGEAGDESFRGWVESPQFAHGHRAAGEAAGGEGRPPVSISAELWSYSVEVSRLP